MCDIDGQGSQSTEVVSVDGDAKSNRGLESRASCSIKHVFGHSHPSITFIEELSLAITPQRGFQNLSLHLLLAWGLSAREALASPFPLHTS